MVRIRPLGAAPARGTNAQAIDVRQICSTCPLLVSTWTARLFIGGERTEWGPSSDVPPGAERCQKAAESSISKERSRLLRAFWWISTARTFLPLTSASFGSVAVIHFWPSSGA